MRIVIPVFDRITALDAVGPYEVLSRMPGAQVLFPAVESSGPQLTENRMLALHADCTIDEVGEADILVFPGGYGTRALLEDERVLGWVRRIDRCSVWTTSVCSGALVLGAAGLLDGRRATTHWLLREELRRYGAEPLAERVVRQGKVITAAGVSAGIDMALHIVADIHGAKLAQAIQLGIEYDPEPPFAGGSTQRAPADIVALVRERAQELA